MHGDQDAQVLSRSTAPVIAHAKKERVEYLGEEACLLADWERRQLPGNNAHD
jgi:hypothetical protein